MDYTVGTLLSSVGAKSSYSAAMDNVQHMVHLLRTAYSGTVSKNSVHLPSDRLRAVFDVRQKEPNVQYRVQTHHR